MKQKRSLTSGPQLVNNSFWLRFNRVESLIGKISLVTTADADDDIGEEGDSQ